MAITNYIAEKLAANAHVYVAGKEVKFVSLMLDQAFGQHHSFQIVMDYDTLKQSFFSNPIEHMQLIGKKVEIDLQQGTDNGGAYEFSGIVQNVIHEGKEGKHGFLIIEGMSMTILLERGKRFDVFCEMDLQRVFTEVTDGIINKQLSCVNKPVYNGQIPFLMQYNESDWEFLQRLSAISGETLFYTGMDLVFGEYKDWQPTEVSYDKEIISFSFGAKLLANNFNRYQYLEWSDETLTQDAAQRIKDSNDYINTVALRSKELTEKRPVRKPMALNVQDKGSLDELVEREKTATASQTIFVTGTAKTCAPRIGRLLTIRMPQNMPEANHPGTYRIVKVRHTIDQNHRYECAFEGIPADLKFFPTPKVTMPVAESLLGLVVKNNDPQGQGRICVEFPFARDRVSETWMRVLTPNAGSSSEVGKNRGMVFVPEVGDQVMVGFEFGDPNRPYVMGSMFHGKNSKGGEADNHIKSIITRSGHTVEFDDASSTLGITIKDKNGNFIHLDTKGKNIEITAPETMTFTAKNMKFEVKENMDISVGKDMTSMVGGDQTNTVSGDMETSANNSTMSITQDATLNVTKAYTEITGESEIATQSGDYIVKSSGKALIQGAEDARISKG